MSNIPGDFALITQDSLTFNNPVSQASLTALGAAINGLLSLLFPVGSIIPSMLSSVQFQAQMGSPSPVTFQLCDGSSVAGSLYATVTGNTNVPDFRGSFLRGQDQGRGLNPDGNLALGTYQGDTFVSHNHNFSDPGHSHGFNQGIGLRQNNYVLNASVLSAFDTTYGGPALTINTATTGISIVAQGGNETRAKNYTINFFMRIN